MSATLPVIESARMESGKSWKALASAMGCDYSTIYHWTRGNRPIPHHKRKLFSEAIGTAIDWARYERERQAKAGDDMVSPDMVPAAPPETLNPPSPQPAPSPRLDREAEEFADLYGI